MQIRVHSLRESLSLVSPVISRKATVRSLLFARMAQGRIAGTNLAMTIDGPLPAHVMGEEEVLLAPVALAMDWLKAVPGDELLTLAQGERKLELSWDGGQASFNTVKLEEYPSAPPKVGEVKLMAEIDGDALVRAMAVIAGYTATESSRPVLNGVCLTLGEPVTLAASDGFRMAYQTLPRVSIPPANGVTEVIVPADAIGVLDGLLKGVPRTSVSTGGKATFGVLMTSGRKMQLEVSDNYFQASFDDVVFTGRVIKGAFPNYKALIPEEPPNQVKVLGPDMMRALKAVEPSASRGSGIVRLEWQPGRMSVSAQDIDSGSVSTIIPATVVKGAAEKIGLNLAYLRQFFRDKDGSVTLCQTGRSVPAMLRAPLGPEVLVMPMAVNWPDQPAKKPEPVKEAEKVVAQAEQAAGKACEDVKFSAEEVAGKATGQAKAKPRKPVVISHRKKEKAVAKEKETGAPAGK